jgi:hypothetical protein
MKTEISRQSIQPEKNYSGVYQQQGRMLTDADWNELVDILKHRLSDALKDVVGNRRGSHGGTPHHRALQIVKAAANDSLSIVPGHIYVDGVAAQIRGESSLLYGEQRDFPAPPEPLPDDCTVYVDVWERTVTHLMDPRLRDAALHGADTCTRKQVMAQVKWCPSDTDPEQSAKNPMQGDAELTITLLKKTTQPDPCDPCAAQLDVDTKTGNYLFRVEVHDVKGDANDPDEITLKWSSENAAEHHGLKNENGDDEAPPAAFASGQFAYEFFDKKSEKHLGVHLASGFTPSREKMAAGYPAAPLRNFVRRWDGFCTLEKKNGSWEVGSQFDGSQSGTGSVTFTNIAAEVLTVQLDAQELVLRLAGKSFVVGDFWLAEVREDDPPTDNILMDKAPPLGIRHHYLTLGKIAGGKLQTNPEADRKFAFPSLTEMTRLFPAGGDGQEVMPDRALPQPLRVGVANGEFPVQGAKVRFHIESGGGSLHPIDDGITDAQGIAACEWTPGAVLNSQYRVKATLVDPDHENDADKDLRPPVYFYANLISAEQVAYLSECSDTTDSSPLNLLQGDPSVSLEPGDEGYYTVKQTLDALLCQLNAKHIPYAPANTECWDGLIPPGAGPPATVQQAVDTLCATERGGGCCTITVSAGEDLAARLTGAIAAGEDAHVCLTVGEYVVKDPVLLEGLGHITFHGCGEGTIIRAPNSEAAVIFNKCKSVTVKHMSLHSHKVGEQKGTQFEQLNGALTIRDVADVVVEDVTLSCAEGGRRMSSCLTVAHSSASTSVRVRGCRMHPGDQQVGLLVVNTKRARIADNEIKVRLKSRKKPFTKRLTDTQYRSTIRKVMLANVVVVAKDTPQDKKRNFQREYEGRTLRFTTPKELEGVWKKIKLKEGMDNRDLIRYIKKLADRYLLEVAGGDTVTDDLVRIVKKWLDDTTPHLPAIAAQGIVCGGRVADDVCITKNSIIGATQGIHLGLSHNDEKTQTYRVGRLLIEANHVVNYLSKQALRKGHGVFVGNFECVHIEKNHLELMKFPWDLKTVEMQMKGILVYGYFGDMLQIRGNHLNNYRETIFARAVDPKEEGVMKLWQVENNMLSGPTPDKPVLDPEPGFIALRNYPYP